MPANVTHPHYSRFTERWEKCRDAIEGEEAVKHKGPKYLPTLSEQEPQDYEAYKTRASFFSASGRTVDGLSGAIQRKPAKVEWPASQADRLESLGRAGESLDQMQGMSIRECLSVGRLGMLVDAPPLTGPTAVPEGGAAYVSI